jgi:hypothetical protein
MTKMTKIKKTNKQTTNNQGNKSSRVPRNLTRFRSEESRKYYNCLTSPFDEQSYGTRVPDQYAVDTTTFCIHKNITLTCDASGNADLMVCPALGQYAFASRSSTISGTTWVSMDGVGAGSWVGITPSSLASKLVNHRIVGMGVRVFSVSSMTNAQGRVLIATIPVENWISNIDTSLNQFAAPFSAAATKSAFYNDWGIANTAGVVDVNSVDQYANHKAYSMLELDETTVEIEPKIISAAAFNFKKSSTNTGSPGGAVTGQIAVAGVVIAGNTDMLRVDGHETVLITVAGGVASTSAIDVEVIFHIEGQISPSTTSASSGLTAASVCDTACDPLGFLEALALAAAAPNIHTVTKAIGKGYSELSKFARSY